MKHNHGYEVFEEIVDNALCLCARARARVCVCVCVSVCVNTCSAKKTYGVSYIICKGMIPLCYCLGILLVYKLSPWSRT